MDARGEFAAEGTDVAEVEFVDDEVVGLADVD